ncbi:MAG: hypothetical protein FJ398_05520 [Verrucomicrobia bacterium]|nr:hypothetical protein [Verrucomicrobiota bacterium]
MAFRPLQRWTPASARKQPEGCGPHGFRFKGRLHGFLAVGTSHEPGRAALLRSRSSVDAAPPPYRRWVQGSCARLGGREASVGH